MNKIENIENEVRNLTATELQRSGHGSLSSTPKHGIASLNVIVRLASLPILQRSRCRDHKAVSSTQFSFEAHASPDFWACFSALPQHIQELARKNFE